MALSHGDVDEAVLFAKVTKDVTPTPVWLLTASLSCVACYNRHVSGS